MGEFRLPFAMVAIAYAIGFLGLAFGIYLAAGGQIWHGAALLRGIGEGWPARVMGLGVVMASALMLVNARALDLVNRHIQPPAAFGIIQIAGTPLVLGATFGLQWYLRRFGRAGAATKPNATASSS